MTTDWLLGWQNLIFILPFGLALLYLLLYAVSGVTFGQPEADADLDADANVDADADAGVHADTDVQANADADTAAGTDHDVHGHAHGHGHGHGPGDLLHGGDDADVAPQPGLFKAALMWLGVGRVPLSLLLMVLLLSWGTVGFIANQAVRERFGDGWRVVLVSLPAAAVLSLLVTRVVVQAISRWLPLDESTARRRHDLLGLHGVAMYDIDNDFGMVTLRDDRGELHQVPCRVADGHQPIAKNEPAVLVAYNRRHNLYKVVSPAANNS